MKHHWNNRQYTGGKVKVTHPKEFLRNLSAIFGIRQQTLLLAFSRLKMLKYRVLNFIALKGCSKLL